MDKYYKMKLDYRYTFGKFRGQRIDEVIKDRIYGMTYAVWAYYNVELLDYHDDVLQALGIKAIEKPGIAPDLYNKFIDSLPEEEKAIVNQHKNNVRMGKWSKHNAYLKRAQSAVMVRDINRHMTIYGKGAMAWKNQGH